MNLRQNKLLMIGGGICAAVLAVELVLLSLNAVRLSKANGSLEQEQQRLIRLLQRDPYPSAENVKVVESNLDELEYRVGELVAEMGRDPFPMDAVEAAEFSARAQDVIERFRKRAERAGTGFSESLEVGFAEYASGGAVPRPVHVPRLSRQLYSVERVADVLVQGGVSSVEGLSRDMFEEAPEDDLSRRRRPRNAPVSNARKLPGVRASEASPDGLYLIERVGVSFTATEDVVWRVLDCFVSAPHFMVVSEFSHQTRSGILSYNPDAVKEGGETDDDTLRFLSEGILTGDKALSRPERIITGNEFVSVSMTIDVYNFNPEVVE